jgi:DNA-binding SARP family transcriptional activator/tetratricopeptide (TPR) repeat protein
MLICRLLGPVEVWFDDERIDLGFPRQRTLLAILLVEVNRLVTVDLLIDRIWADRPPARAAHALYADVSKLRRALIPASGLHLVRQTGGYLIEADPAAIDLHRFRALRSGAHSCGSDEGTATLLDEALALWRGEAFVNVDNHWLTTLRGPLNSEKLAVVLDRNDAYLRLGRHTHLLTDLAGLSAAHPLDERLAAQYILALYRCGAPAEALTHYHHTRGNLAEELGVDPGPALQELHEQVLRNDPHLRIAIPPLAPAQPTPQQLPPQAPHFIGRVEELRELTALLDTALDTSSGTTSNAGMGTGSTVVISAIGGAGGIGKTWLALHWAHQHLDRFPDGQLFVDLRGFTPAGDPMTPETAVRGLLDGLEVDPNRIPIDLDAQVALYRSTIAGKRMLIVLDNAADTAQVTPLLPGSPTCAVVITSRRYMPSLVTGHQAHHLPLGVLTETDARRLLSARLGADRVTAEAAAVQTLLACSAGFPLALGIVIGRALAHPQFPLSVLAAELADTTSALGALDDADAAASLPAVLSWSVRALTTEQVRVFGLLGIAPGPDISLPAAASLTALPPQQARAVLRELEHASLIQQHAPNRYRMHDLIRLYATEQAKYGQPADQRTEALHCLIDFYLHTAYRADRLLYPHRPPIDLERATPSCVPSPVPDADAAMTWFDAEHTCLLAAQLLATKQGWHREVWQLAWSLSAYHRRRGRLQDDGHMWWAALAAGEQLNDPAVLAQAHKRIGGGLDPQQKLEHLRQALTYLEEAGDIAGQIDTHQALTALWLAVGQAEKALASAQDALRLASTSGNPVWEADALNAVGFCEAELGRFPPAREHCEQALRLQRAHHNGEGEAETLDSLGYLDHRSGRYASALDYYQQALDAYERLNFDYQKADTLERIGDTYVALGAPGRANDMWRQAIRLYAAQHRAAKADHLRQQLLTDQ